MVETDLEPTETETIRAPQPHPEAPMAASPAPESTSDVSRIPEPRSETPSSLAGNLSCAAARVKSTAASIQERTAELPAMRTVRRTFRGAAENFNHAIRYVRHHDAQDMMDDVKEGLGRYPTPCLVTAALAGFLVGRVLKSKMS